MRQLELPRNLRLHLTTIISLATLSNLAHIKLAVPASCAQQGHEFAVWQALAAGATCLQSVRLLGHLDLNDRDNMVDPNPVLESVSGAVGRYLTVCVES